MTAKDECWVSWAHFLHRFDLERPAAYLLEAAGPLSILLAQMLYLGQPFLTDAKNRQSWSAMAKLLEDPGEVKAFAEYLKEESIG